MALDFDSVPRILEKVLVMDAVYWDPIGDSQHADPIYDHPVELKVRWTESAEQFIAYDGSQRVSNSKILLGNDVQIRGLIMLGTLADVEDFENPRNNENSWEIMSYRKVPDRKATKFVRRAIV